MAATTLAMAGTTHGVLKGHLLPGDGCEAAAMILCARIPGPRVRLVVREIVFVPHDACITRRPDVITWPGILLEEAIDRGEDDELVIILFHSHPGGQDHFSRLDDTSDQVAIQGLLQAYGECHGSAIMLPNGAVRARLYDRNMVSDPVDLVTISGDEIQFWWTSGAERGSTSERPVAFTGEMAAELEKLTAVVIGVSGTGSIQAEQAARLGFGKVVLIDFDRVERRNLNRILNTTRLDAQEARLKVKALAKAISEYRGANTAKSVPERINSRAAVLAASQGDVLFCCVDTLEGRYFADLIAAAFLIPLFDVGVTIPTRKKGDGIAIADAVGRIDYVQPGGATLADRRVYTPETLRAEYLRAVAPAAHAQEVEEGYIEGAIEEAPGVISLNMQMAAACMNEFILRAFPFRIESNSRYARTLFSLATGEVDYFSEADFQVAFNPVLGRGGQEPLLGQPALAQ